jgi:hypothetical protein
VGRGKILRVQKPAIFTILTSRVDVAGYLGQFHFLNTSEKARCLELAIFAILTLQVDVAGYLRQFHFLTTSEKLSALDFKPIGPNPTFGLKCAKNIKFRTCIILRLLTF